MGIPSAIVRVELLALKGVPAAVVAPGELRWARARFSTGTAAPVLTGRSRPLPDAGGNFDLTAEQVPWVFEARMEPGEAIDIEISLGVDRGDAAPGLSMSANFRIADPWKPGEALLPGLPGLQVRVQTQLVKPADRAFIARARSGSGVSGTLWIPDGYLVEFESIDGLYAPDPAAKPPQPGAQKRAGYTSTDNAGRVYTNRQPDGSWARDTQYIDVVAKVTAVGARTLTPAIRLLWTVEDLDDPTNDDPECHREAGRWIDANDYDGSGRSLGACARDNASAFSAGNADEDLVFGAGAKGSARWATLPGYPAPAPASREQARSDLKLENPRLGRAGVRLHCPNVLGTNFRLRAALDGTPGPVFAANTGCITMWSRIDVEVVRMAGAHSVAAALGSVAIHLTPARVQLDFQLERTVSGADDIDEMVPPLGDLSAASANWIGRPGVFTHRGQPGWFFLGAARLPKPLPSSKPPPLYSGPDYQLGVTGSEPWVEVKGNRSAADYVKFEWAGVSAGFGVDRADIAVRPGWTRLYIDNSDVTPTFTGHDADGSLDHAYRTMVEFYPAHQRIAGVLSAGGFGIPAAGATVTLMPKGGVQTTGISPTVSAAAPPHTGRYFAGRTILFTRTAKFSTGPTRSAKPDFDSLVVGTVVHEFLHAFGMPHKCGQWDWRTPRVASCCMNYWDTWLLDAAGKPLVGTAGKHGHHVCGRHLMEVRRVHLERNLGLGW